MLVDIVIPAAGESVTSGVISRWLKPEGAFATRDEPILEVETDKVTLEVPAPAAGGVQRLAKEGDTVAIGAVVGRIDTAVSAPAVSAKSPAGAPAVEATATRPERAQVATEAAGPANGEVRATPLARKVAAEHSVALSGIAGTGPGHRVREADVVGAIQSRSAGAPAPTRAAPNSPSGGSSRERMTPLRQRIAQRLVQAQHTAAMLTTFNEVDMGAVLELRKQHKEEFEKRHGVGLGFMSFFVKAAVSALQAFPLVNASIVDDGGHPAIEKHEHVDIAVAVSTPKGLVVPVLRDCARLSMPAIELGIKDLAARARDGKLALEDMQGGTFTITNGGVFGSLMSTPILNPPQSAILGMHTIKNRPVEYPAGSGQIALRPMMYLAVSYDHRIIDGSEAVQFLVRIKQAIEDPARLLLNM